MNRSPVLIAISVAATLALAGCASSSSGPGTTPPSVADSMYQTQAQPTSALAGGPSSAAGSPSAPDPSASSAAAAASKAAAARAAAIHRKRVAAENRLISAAKWDAVIRNPDAYAGNIYTISGTVAEYNVNSNTLATQESAALVATDANGNDFVVEAPASILGDAQPGDTFTAKVTVLGAEQAENTVYGGTSEVPDFDASAFTVTG